MDKEKINAAWASWKSENVKSFGTSAEEDAIDEQLLYTDIGKEVAMKIAAAPVVTGMPLHFALFGAVTTAIQFGVYLGKLQRDEQELNHASR